MDAHFQVIRTNWSPTAEAKLFFRLIQVGVTTPDGALADIAMTQEQRNMILLQFPEHRQLVEATYRLRCAATRKLNELIRGNGRKAG